MLALLYPSATQCHMHQEHGESCNLCLVRLLCVTFPAICASAAQMTCVLRPAGLAVVWDMLLTTQFLTLVMITVWRVPTAIALCFHLFFSAIEATFFSACAEKVPTGSCASRAAFCMHKGLHAGRNSPIYTGTDCSHAS